MAGSKTIVRSRSAARARRHLRVRKKVTGSAARPRLTVTRSARHTFAPPGPRGGGGAGAPGAAAAPPPPAPPAGAPPAGRGGGGPRGAPPPPPAPPPLVRQAGR